MPDPLLYVQAWGASAAVAALAVLAIASARRPTTAQGINAACVVGIGGGVAIGCYVLRLPVAWPPANGLDRLLTIVLPAALVVEAVSGFKRVPRWLAWLLRLGLAAAMGRVLLHGSVYLSGPSREWTSVQTIVLLAICAALVAVVWVMLSWLAERSPGVSIPLAVALSIQCAGIAIMLAGYIAGGATALPLAAALVGATVVLRRVTPLSDSQATIGIGVVALCGLAFIGVFFGRLSTASALAIVLAPLLCWTTELPMLRGRTPWVAGSLRLLLVAIPLAVVLGLAALDFARHTAPLLVEAQDRITISFSCPKTASPFARDGYD